MDAARLPESIFTILRNTLTRRLFPHQPLPPIPHTIPFDQGGRREFRDTFFFLVYDRRYKFSSSPLPHWASHPPPFILLTHLFWGGRFTRKE